MGMVVFARSSRWNHLHTAKCGTPIRASAKPDEAVLNLEFGESMRSARLSAGWFILPSAALSALVILIVLHS